MNPIGVAPMYGEGTVVSVQILYPSDTAVPNVIFDSKSKSVALVKMKGCEASPI